jgi:hypothetical protein
VRMTGRLAVAVAYVMARMLPAVAQDKASEKPGMVVADLVVLGHTEAVAIAVGKL